MYRISKSYTSRSYVWKIEHAHKEGFFTQNSTVGATLCLNNAKHYCQRNENGFEFPEWVVSFTENGRIMKKVNVNCSECGIEFDLASQGKVRRAETYCTIECADKAHPDIAEANRKHKEQVEWLLSGINKFGNCSQ